MANDKEIRMSKNRKRRKKSEKTNDIPKDWPIWFKPITNLVERKILELAFKKNGRLGEVYFIVQNMQTSYLVFKKIFDELETLQANFDRPLVFQELALETQNGQQVSQYMILEFTRLLHNFLASAKMLVEVTRRWVRKEFDGSPFLETYQDEIQNRFLNNIHAQFLEDLRNFTLHRALPLSVPELRMHKVSEHELKSSLGVVLLKDYLLEWNGWSEFGSLQIQMAIDDEQVDIQPILRGYFKNVTGFTQWLFWQVNDLFGAEIKQINNAIESVNKKQ